MTAVVVLVLLMVGSLVFWLVRSILLHRRVANLENRLAALERSVRGNAVQQSPASPASEISLVDAKPQSEIRNRPDETTSAPSTPSSLPEEKGKSLRDTSWASGSRTREEWEAFVGGRLLNRIGAFAIVIGIGFFLKHAFDSDWISEPIRVVIGILAGVASLFIARRTHTRGYSIFAQGLVGAGIGILYLSVYASFNYYSLLPQIPSFILMAVVTTTALVHGVWYQSLAAAILGWAGGYLTPWMLGTGEPDEIKLFVYLALLTVAMLGLAVRMPRWAILQPITLAGTWLWYFTWYFQVYDRDAMAMTLFFILVFWSAFVSADQLQQRLHVTLGWERFVALLANAAFGLLAVILVLSSDDDVLAGIVLLVIAGVYLLPFVRAQSPPERRYATSTAAVATVCAVIGLGYLLSDHGDVAAWTAMAVLLVAAARRFNHPDLVLIGQVVVLTAAVHLITIEGALAARALRDYVPVLHERSIGFLGLITGSFAAFTELRQDSYRRRARTMFLSIAGVAAIVFVTVEVNDILRAWRLDLDQDMLAFRWFISLLTVGVMWTALGLGLFVWGLRQSLQPLMWIGVATLGIGILTVALRGMSVNVITYHTPILNVRVASMLLAAVLSATGAWIALRYESADPSIPIVHRFLAIGAVVLILSLISGETFDWFERFASAAKESGPAVLADLQDEQQLALSLVWLLYSAALLTLGFWRSKAGLRLMAIVLFGITILKIFLYDLSFLETAYRIVSIVVLGAILLAVSYGYQRYKHLLI